MGAYTIWTVTMGQAIPTIGDYFITTTGSVYRREPAPNSNHGYWKEITNPLVIDQIKLEHAEIKNRKKAPAPGHYGDY